MYTENDAKLFVREKTRVGARRIGLGKLVSGAVYIMNNGAKMFVSEKNRVGVRRVGFRRNPILLAPTLVFSLTNSFASFPVYTLIFSVH